MTVMTTGAVEFDARKIHAAAPQELIFPFKLCAGNVTSLRAARAITVALGKAYRFLFQVHQNATAMRSVSCSARMDSMPQGAYPARRISINSIQE